MDYLEDLKEFAINQNERVYELKSRIDELQNLDVENTIKLY